MVSGEGFLAVAALGLEEEEECRSIELEEIVGFRMAVFMSIDRS